MSKANIDQLWRRAQAMQAQAAQVGFDWPDIDGVFAKLREEIDEVQSSNDIAQRREEVGDVLFVLAHLARRLDIDAAAALGMACDKFDRRFAQVMAMPETLPPLGDAGRLDAMEARWQAAKRSENASDPDASSQKRN